MLVCAFNKGIIGINKLRQQRALVEVYWRLFIMFNHFNYKTSIFTMKKGDLETNELGSSKAQDSDDSSLEVITILSSDCPDNPSPNTKHAQHKKEAPKKTQQLDQFAKLLEQVKKKQEEERNRRQKVHEANIKKAQVLKRTQKANQKELKSKLDHERRKKQYFKNRALKTIEPFVRQFKALSSNNADTQVSHLRKQSKQKIFKWLMYGIEELKFMPKQQLKQSEHKLVALDIKDAYAAIRNITTQIDILFVNRLNAGNTQSASKKYKNHLKTLTMCLEQQSNLYLRRKVISQEITAKKMLSMAEQEFYPPEIQQKIKERNNLLIKHSMSRDCTEAQEEDESQSFSGRSQADISNSSLIKENQFSSPYFEDKEMLLALKQLLSNNSIQKMRALLSFEDKQVEKKLKDSFDQVFPSKLN